MIKIEQLEIPDIVILTPPKFGDERGFFSEVFNARAMKDAGIDLDFVQDNHSYSAAEHVLRGLHYQTPPCAQDKLVRCTRGAILDVAVDIRKGSPNFGKWVSAVISAENWAQILVPKGFAHGFITLEPDTEVLYKVTDFYSKPNDAGLAWNDPDIAIDWGLGHAQPTLSAKDQAAPRLCDTDTQFVY